MRRDPLANPEALIRRFYGRPLDTLLLTWGVSLILQQVARDIFGAPNVQVRAPQWLVGGADFGGVRLPYARLFIAAVAAVSVLGVWFYQNRLAPGRRMRAVVQNRQLAATCGIHTGRTDQLTLPNISVKSYCGGSLISCIKVNTSLPAFIPFTVSSWTYWIASR